MKIKYGKGSTYVDITTNVLKDGCVKLPACDAQRARIIGVDPCYGIVKNIIIEDNFGNAKFYEDNVDINIRDDIPITEQITSSEKLSIIHSRFNLKYGNKLDEYPEQIMAVSFISPEDRVLEIGSNIGRNSLVISFLLNDDSNFLTMECDPVSVLKLTENRDINGRTFLVENSALSLIPLIQKGWDTFPLTTNEIPDGFSLVETITLQQLREKYQINFNVLVLDCEGAFFYILRDMAEILDGIEKIIIENDFYEANKKVFVDQVLKDNSFSVVYEKAGGFGPCYSCFYQVWKKI